VTPSDLLDWGEWKPLVTAVGVVLVVGASIFGLGYWQGINQTRGEATQAENAANIAKGENHALKAQALAKDAEIAAKDAGLEAARAGMAVKVSELARLRKVAGKPNGPTLNDDQLQPDYRDTNEIICISIKQDEVIKSQAEVIRLQDVKISDLIISRDLHKQRAEAVEREALNLRAALAAKDGLIRAAQLKGFAYGFAFGAASGGYAGYRVGTR